MSKNKIINQKLEPLGPEDHIAGHVNVGRNDQHEVVIQLIKQPLDENGDGFMIFSPRQARNLARLLVKHAEWAEAEKSGRKSPYEGITGGG